MGRYHALLDIADEVEFAELPLGPEAPSSWRPPSVVTRAMSFLERKKLMTPDEFGALADQYRSAGFQIAGVQNKGMLGAARMSLADSLAKGATLNDAAAQLNETLDLMGYGSLRPWHARLVAHMNYASAYGRAQWDALRDPRVRGLLPFFKYITRADGRVRPTHAAMHGKYFRRDNPVWNAWWPPCGWGCRCKVVGVTAGTVATYGIKDDRWPRDPSDRRRRVRPEPGFGGNPGTFIRQQSSAETAAAQSQARAAARAGRAPHGALGRVPGTPAAPGERGFAPGVPAGTQAPRPPRRLRFNPAEEARKRTGR